MQCEFFAILVDELAHERENGSGLTRRLLNHARECRECGKRLSEAQALTGSLRALAAADAQMQAPDRSEAALVDYFRRQRRHGAVRLWEGKWLAAAACACLVAVGLAIWVRHGSQPLREVQPVIITAPEAPPAARDLGREEMAAQANRNATLGPAGRAVSPAESADYSGFIPLPYDEGSTSQGSSQIVHVEVSRSALASMGFPVTEAASGSYVEADILIGEDGMATAIRFDSQESDLSR
ncbi:MAG: hypothetical protein ACRD1J_01420 [Terriglobia bacterium]